MIAVTWAKLLIKKTCPAKTMMQVAGGLCLPESVKSGSLEQVHAHYRRVPITERALPLLHPSALLPPLPDGLEDAIGADADELREVSLHRLLPLGRGPEDDVTELPPQGGLFALYRSAASKNVISA